jgi:hypothetical protein
MIEFSCNGCQMTLEELREAFDRYCLHFVECNRHSTKALAYYMEHIEEDPPCSCGLAKIREKLGLPKEEPLFIWE